MTAWLRPARPTDAGTLGDILWSFAECTDWMPELFSAAECIGLCGDMIDRGWVSVAGRTRHPEAFLARDRTEICAIYVAENARGSGMGSLLLNNAKRATDRLTLWTVASNVGAQKFYRCQGFSETHRARARTGDENLAEVHYLWTKETGNDPRPGSDRS